MLVLSKSEKWDLAADPNDLIGLVHELERVLVESASSIEGLGLADYFVMGGAVSRGQVSADDLLDFVASLSQPLQSIASNYSNFKQGDDFYRFKIHLVKIKSDSRPVNVTVQCSGPSTETADRLFKQVFQQFAREIGRRNRLRSAGPTQTSPSRPPVSQSASTNQPADEPTFWKVLTTNPFVVAFVATVVGGLLVAGIMLLIGMYIKSDQTANGPAATPPTVTKTITTDVTAPAGSPSPQVTGSQSQVPGH